MSKWRRYLYLLLDHSDKGNYPMRRIDASTLFCPVNQKITPTEIEDARLPAPFISFTASPTADYGSRVLDFFTLFGRGEKKSLIAGADENGLTVMYDLDQRTVHNQLRLNEQKDIDVAPSPSVTPYMSSIGLHSCATAAALKPLCMTKEYNLVSKEGYVVPQLEAFGIFTGFVMDLDGSGGLLRMTKHKSRRYMIPPIGIGWVF
ncbi:hypothetical protein C2845_PM13G14310 [Panicum miliaceum]|uniref:Uncharacterized protein n=1 Tax=Panicum miliaceum TaxID=4540 RepID=A0A3L6RL97_PANMI|nr:hypothetical protein C2845_PM13G14310 [Panicum miliaceum]